MDTAKAPSNLPPTAAAAPVDPGIAAGLLYLALLCVPLRLGNGQLLLADAMLPAMIWCLFRRREQLLTLLISGGRLLLLAAAWATTATLVQFVRGSGSLYDLSILGYMCFIYCYFRIFAPDEEAGWRLGTAALGLFLAGWLAGIVAGCTNGASPLMESLFYSENTYGVASGNPLARRYQFLFVNPNLLGSAFVLPVILAIPRLKRILSNSGVLKSLGILVAAFILTLPLLSTVSKHLITTMAVLAATFATAPALQFCRPRIVAAGCTILAAVGCVITVWFCTAPAVRTSPWVDFSRTSCYMTHQEIYLKLLTHSTPMGMLFGYSPQELQQEYPKYADEAKIAAVLKPYKMEEHTQRFATYMDPHNEFLNTAAHFGVPAMLFLVAFWVGQIILCAKTKNLTGLYFVAAALCTFLWDDMASKRWLWLTLALAVTQRNGQTTTPP